MQCALASMILVTHNGCSEIPSVRMAREMRIFRQGRQGRSHGVKIWGSSPAAGPPLEPAGVLSRSYGFRTAPAMELSEKVGENAHSPMFPFPNSSAPAPFNLATLRHTESLRRPVCRREAGRPESYARWCLLQINAYQHSYEILGSYQHCCNQAEALLL